MGKADSCKSPRKAVRGQTSDSGPEQRGPVPAQSSEGGTALRGGLVVGKLPTSLGGGGEKVDAEELILCHKLGRFRKAREMAIVFLS